MDEFSGPPPPGAMEGRALCLAWGRGTPRPYRLIQPG